MRRNLIFFAGLFFVLESAFAQGGSIQPLDYIYPFSPEPETELQRLQRERGSVLDSTNFGGPRPGRKGNLLVLKPEEVSSWIENHSLYKKRLADPDSPERDLFLFLVERAKMNTSNTSLGPVFTAPGKNDDASFFAMLAYSVNSFQGHSAIGLNGEKDLRVFGQMVTLWKLAGSSESRIPAKLAFEIEIFQRFFLVGLALGAQTPEDFKHWAANLVLDDILVGADIRRKDESSKGQAKPLLDPKKTKVPFTDSYNRIQGTNVFPFASDANFRIYRNWSSFDYLNLPPNGNPVETYIEANPLKVIHAQVVFAEQAEVKTQQQREFSEAVIANLDLKRALGKKGDALTPNEISAIERIAVEALEFLPDNLSRFASSRKAPELPFLSPGDWSKIQTAIIASAGEFIYRNQRTLSQERKKQKLANILLALHTEDSGEISKKFEDDFEMMIFNEIMRAIDDGRLQPLEPKPVVTEEDEDLDQQVFDYIDNSLPALIDGSDFLRSQIAALEKHALKHLKATELTPKQKTNIRTAYSEAVAAYILNEHGSLASAASEALDATQKKLAALGLSAEDVFGNPWANFGVEYFFRREEDPPVDNIDKVLDAFKAAYPDSNSISIAADLSGSIPNHARIFFTPMPDEYKPYGRNGKGEKWPIGMGYPSGKSADLKKIMYRVALVFLLSRPKKGIDLAITLGDRNKMKEFTGDPKAIVIPDYFADEIYTLFLSELSAMLYREACSRGLAQAKALFGAPKTSTPNP